MAITTNGIWFPTLPNDPPGTGTGFGGGNFLVGPGVPDDSLGSDGMGYGDSVTGDLYIKDGGTWTLFVGGSGGFGNLSGTGSPVGVVTPQELHQLYTDTSGPFFWQATGLTSADWSQRT